LNQNSISEGRKIEYLEKCISKRKGSRFRNVGIPPPAKKYHI
jgi:hypothetical protein